MHSAPSARLATSLTALPAFLSQFDMTKRGGLLAMATMVIFFVVIVTLIVGLFWGKAVEHGVSWEGAQ